MLILAFCLMLLVMTYNTGVIFMLCTGLSLGHFAFKMIGLPELPSYCKTVAGSGAYMPEPDNCCNKVEKDCDDGCPMTKDQPQIYTRLQDQTNESNEMYF